MSVQTAINIVAKYTKKNGFYSGGVASCTQAVNTKSMRNITLSAADTLIDRARERARLQGLSLDDEFRKWLASYFEEPNGANAVTRFRAAMQTLSQVDAGRVFCRDEMNER